MNIEPISREELERNRAITLPQAEEYAPGHSFPARVNPVHLLALYDMALASLTTSALEKVGRSMVELTTTVHNESEWPVIPVLWEQCMKERDAAQAHVKQLQEALREIGEWDHRGISVEDAWNEGLRSGLHTRPTYEQLIKGSK